MPQNSLTKNMINRTMHSRLRHPCFLSVILYTFLSAQARLPAPGRRPAGVPADDCHDDAGDDHFVRPLSRPLSLSVYIIAGAGPLLYR